MKIFWTILFFPLVLWTQNSSFKFNWEKIEEVEIQKIGVAGPVAGNIQDIIIYGGGANFPDTAPWYGGKKIYYQEGEWFSKDDKGSFLLPEHLAYAGLCSTPKGLVIAGGENDKGKTNKVWLTTFDRISQEVNLEPLPELPLALSNLSLTHYDNTLYLAGGESHKGPFNQLLTLNLNAVTLGWTVLDSLPTEVSHANLVSQSNGEKNQLYLIGGRKVKPDEEPEIFSSVWAYDLQKKKWEPKAHLPLALAAGTAIATGANYILQFGGDSGEIFKKSIATQKILHSNPDPNLKASWIAEMENHPGFEKNIYLYNTITNQWSVLDTIPFQPPVTTQIVAHNGEYYFISGEISPGKRTPYIQKGTISGMPKMNLADYSVLIGYLILMVVIGIAVAGKQSTTEDYFKGGQKIPGWAAGLSIYGTQLSAITFMSIPAKTYASNWNYFILQMTIIMVMPFVASFFIPFYRKLNITTAYEILEKRFNYLTRSLASLLFILLQLGRLGIVLLLPSLALAIVTGLAVQWSIL